MISYAVAEYYENTETKRRQPAGLSQNFLQAQEKIIKKRIAELKERGWRVDDVLDKTNDLESGQWQGIRQKLLSAREIVKSQLARYLMQRMKIELVRQQNQLAPVLDDLPRLKASEAVANYQKIDKAKKEIGEIRGELTKFYADDFPAQVLSDKENFLAELDEAAASCQKLREAMLAQEAVRALQGVSPLAENLHGIAPSSPLARELAAFNIQVSLTDFSNSFDELEAEYQRLKSESDISRQLAAKLDQI